VSTNGRRPKGYITGWSPQPQTTALLEQVQEVLAEYRSFLPMTARQIFYRLVGQYDYDKTELAYSRLCEALVKARRAQVIPFSSIRDDGTTVTGGSPGYDGPDEWWEGELSAAEGYRRDRTDGQPCTIEVWCEAAGMAPQLGRVAQSYQWAVYSTGGFSSVTVTHEVAQRVLGRDRPTVFLHIGDYDPSGESIFEAMSQDIGAFVIDSVGGKWNASTGETVELNDSRPCLFKPRRVALTAEQVEEYDLPTAPPKRSDTRSANWAGQTCQAEAMDPQTLADVVREAIETEMDLERFEAVKAAEETERDTLVAEVKSNLEGRSA
jgi:hypothetical protein